MRSNKELPFINVRDLVLFPQTQIVLYIGRSFSIESINYARENTNGSLYIFSQKKGDMDKPFNKSDMYPVGAKCKIVECVHYPDNTMKVLIKVMDIVELDTLKKVKDLRKASAKKLNITGAIKLNKQEKSELVDLLVRWSPEVAYNDRAKQLQDMLATKSNSQFLAKVFRFVCSPRDKVNKYTKSSKIKVNKEADRGTQKRQELLMEKNSAKRLKMLKELLINECIREIKNIA